MKKKEHKSDERERVMSLILLLCPGAKILSVLWYNLGAAKLKTGERILFI